MSMKKSVTGILAVAAAGLVLASSSCSRGRPVGPGDVVAEKAMVASAHPAASAVG